MLRIATDHRNERVEEEREDQDDFATGEPKLSLTIGLDSEDVDCTRAGQLGFYTMVEAKGRAELSSCTKLKQMDGITQLTRSK